MTIRNTAVRACRTGLAVIGALGVLSAGIAAPGPPEDHARLRAVPEDEQGDQRAPMKPGALGVTWKDGGKTFEYPKDGKIYRFDVATKAADRSRPGPGAAPARRAGAAAAAGRAAARRAAGRWRRPTRPTRR